MRDASLASRICRSAERASLLHGSESDVVDEEVPGRRLAQRPDHNLSDAFAGNVTVAAPDRLLTRA